jgi:hypothetical protein
MGKPTWGAAADYVLSAGGSAGGMEMGTGKGDEKGRVKTCWYWANYEGKCNNTSETCKYLHEFTSAGVATRPIQWKKPWTRWGTESENGKEEGGEEEGESSERAWGKTDESVSAWGESSTDKYKPPHIKALEEKAKIEEMGW